VKEKQNKFFGLFIIDNSINKQSVTLIKGNKDKELIYKKRNALDLR
jgi:hypothetical protein